MNEKSKKRFSLGFKALIFLCFLSLRAGADLQFQRSGSLPPSLVLDAPFSGSKLKDFHFRTLRFDFNGRDRFSVHLPGANSLYSAELPIVPVAVEPIPKKPGFRTEVSLNIEEVEESVGPVPLRVTPKALVWGEDLRFPKAMEEGLFPGTFLKTIERSAGTFAQIFPVQYDLNTGKVYVLKKSSLWVRHIPEEIKVDGRGFADLVSLILTSRKLETSALALAEFQWKTSRLKSQIVYTEDLKNEPMVDEATLPNGYKNGLTKEQKIRTYNPIENTGYNYDLAKKIIHFLRDRMESKESNLRYVTLLGDAQHVPPSYYFYLPGTVEEQWGVTDQCYSSLSNCLEPKLALGRLPFSTNEEVAAYLTKANRHFQKLQEPSKELGLVAGKAFPGYDVYTGELGSLRLVQDPSADWKGVEKFFVTKRRYSDYELLNLFSGRFDTRFLYALDHGKGNRWYIEDKFLSTSQIEGNAAIENPHTPILVSMACSNAAFDASLVQEPIFEFPKSGKESVGMALLKHKAGVIAYWGEARPGVGNPVYNFDQNGNLSLEGSNYGLQLLEAFFESYRRGKKGRIGDYVLRAQNVFAFERGNNMKDPINVWTYYITTLLGDPTLVLPERKEVENENLPIGRSNSSFLPSNDPFKELPFINFELETFMPLKFAAPALVNATLFRKVRTNLAYYGNEEIAQELLGVTGEQSLNVQISKDTVTPHFLRIENAQGVPRERQVWFDVKMP